MRLYIAEKSSQAEILAKVMGLKRKGRGYEGNYKGVPSRIVYLSGHVMKNYDLVDYLKEEGTLDDFVVKEGKSKGKLNWRACYDKLIPFFPKEFKKKPKTKADDKRSGRSTGTDYEKVYKEAVKACKEADEIVLSPDPDDEGVTLAMEIVDAAKQTRKVMGMIKLNALEESAVRRELDKIDPKKWKHHYAAGLCRSEYDWSFGINLTIEATVLFGTLLHVGGVKAPTMKMVVERDLENENFKKKYLYGVEAQVEKDGVRFPVRFKLDAEKKEDAEKLLEEIKRKGVLKVESFSVSKKSKPAPLPFSKTQLQAYVSKKGVSLKDSNAILQKLYEMKFTSYPRSSCNYYSSDLYSDVPEIMKAVGKDSVLGKYVSMLKPPYRKGRAFNDEEVDKHSHTALSPLSQYDESKLDEKQKKVYRAIAGRFLAQFFPDYEYTDVSGKTELGGEFGEKVKTGDGWQTVEKVDSHKDKREIPDLSEGDELKVVSVSVTQKETKPRPKFTKASLTAAMENVATVYNDETLKKILGTGKNAKGIGTPATRDVIVEQLVKDGYFAVEGKREVLTSTKKARDLINAIGEYISAPHRRAEMEENLQKIRDGEMGMEEFRKAYREFVTKCCDILKEQADRGVKVSSDRAPTPKMVKYARSLAKSNGVKIDKEILSSFEKTKEFINKYGGGKQEKERNGYGFSDKQMAVIEKHGSEELKSLAKKEGMSKEDFERAKKMLDDVFKSWKKGKRRK